MNFIGIDGSKGGWVACCVDENLQLNFIRVGVWEIDKIFQFKD